MDYLAVSWAAARLPRRADRRKAWHASREPRSSPRTGGPGPVTESGSPSGRAPPGPEGKSPRAGRASLADGFALVSDGEVWLHNVHIPEYTQGTWTNHLPRRTRKLLLHRGEIERLVRKASEQGLTLVPLSLYFKDGKVKVELALARGKRTYDKRQDLAKRDAAREVERALRRRR